MTGDNRNVQELFERLGEPVKTYIYDLLVAHVKFWEYLVENNTFPEDFQDRYK